MSRADRSPGGIRCVEEQPDQLAGRRPLLLSDDDPAAERIAQGERTLDGRMVGDADDVEAGRSDGFGELVGCRRRVAGPHRVQVAIDPEPARWAGCGKVRVALDGAARQLGLWSVTPRSSRRRRWRA